MSDRDRSHLTPVPGPHDEAVLAWIVEPEPVSSARVIDRAFAELSRTPQSRPRPWDGFLDSLRPEPFGTNVQHLGLLLVVAGLVLAAAAAGLLAGGGLIGPGQPSPIAPSGPPSPSASPTTHPSSTLTAVFPLAAEPIEIVVNDGTHQSASNPGTGALSVVRADGTGRRKIGTDLPDDLVWPEWVPGTETVLALQGTFDAHEQIWAIDATGGGRSQVLIPCVNPCGSRNEAAVSHDGAKVVFFQAWGKVVNGLPEQCGLSLYTFATQAIRPMTDHGCGPPEERHPRFSPDDKTVAFWRSNAAGDPANDPNAQSAIFTRNLTTGAETRVTEWALSATMLDWSPDGQWIVFVQRVWDERAPEADLWRVHPDGKGLERMTTLDTATSRLLRPLYTPDGRWILFMRLDASGGTLLGIPSEGGTPVGVLPGFQVFEHDERAVP